MAWPYASDYGDLLGSSFVFAPTLPAASVVFDFGQLHRSALDAATSGPAPSAPDSPTIGAASQATQDAAANMLYDFYFEYSDGSFYYGTVASDSSYGYYTGENIATTYGTYYVYSSAGTTSEAAGTVYTSEYYDVTSGSYYTPYYYSYGDTDGSSGLGSELDYTYGANGYQAYGNGGEYEAKQGSNTLYDFYFEYNDGSFYYGTVASNSSYGYYSGEELTTGYGFYYLYASAGATAQAAGTVSTSEYYDVTSGSYYTPYYYNYGDADGSSGLGSELDYTYGTNGYQAYGYGGDYEAKQGASNTLYDFYFEYNDGSFYYGTVASNSSYGYYSGEELTTGYGFYYLYGSSGATTEAAGTVATSEYYDVTSAAYYTPYYYSYGDADGSSGLGSELDYTYGTNGYQLYGYGGDYEAKQGGSTLYDFYFEYNDGSFYYGTVASNSSYGYYSGEELTTGYGFYYLYASAGATSQAAGTVSTNEYYDVTSGSYYTPYYYSYGDADGSSGLGSELDYTYGANGYQLYGYGGDYEAKQDGSTLYDFYFEYNDGSFYYGTVASNSGYGYYSGEELTTGYGFYYLYASAGATAQAAGTVSTSEYYDVTSGSYYTPYYYNYGDADGSSGLGSELDDTYGTNGYQQYGAGGGYEAKQGSTLFDFYFEYNDGSFYYGTVASNSSYGYYSGEELATGYGYYYVYASAGTTSEAAGTVVTSYYYDVSSGSSYTPYYYGYGKADGSSGLGSEYDFTYGAAGYKAYGYGGEDEATQGTSTSHALIAFRDAAATNTAYAFTFSYTDGSTYGGTVADDGTYAYTPGETIATSFGTYRITADLGATSDAAGSVVTNTYFDSTSHQGYVPVDTTAGIADGSAGLGSERDSIVGAQGTIAFGHGGTLEAREGIALFDFTFSYADGSRYQGTVADNGTYGYVAGETITTADGAYSIGGAAGTAGEAPGTVLLTSYYDSSSSTAFTPTSDGAAGTAGLGSEIGTITGNRGPLTFGEGGTLEAREGDVLLDFNFVYVDGSRYEGTVADNGTYGYVAGETIATNDGTYTITSEDGTTGQAPGIVSIASYYDAASAQSYTPVDTAAHEPDGSAGLGSEQDSIIGGQGTLAFGEGGTLEAREAATLFVFNFTYTDGSYYQGTVADNGSYGIHAGEIVTTAGGSYLVSASAGATTVLSGSVSVDDYFDIYSDAFYTPVDTQAGEADGSGGLGSELDQVVIGGVARTFGEGGLYQAGGAVPCYCRGTRILTDRGEVPVEALRIGDRAITASGTPRAIRWIGTRSYDGRFIAGNRDALPITIRRGALAAGVPHRDLAVSPLHALFLGGVLIPAERLVNGRSIIQAGAVKDVTYFHVELESHDILLAEGAPAESFIDCDSRAMFHNAHEFAALYPDGTAPRWTFCAERLVAGPALEAIRRRIAERAGLSLGHADDAAEPGAIEGRIDVVEHGLVSGWAFDPARPCTPLVLEIVVDGATVATAVANAPRADLAAAGKGRGWCAFTYRFDMPLDAGIDHAVTLRAGDGRDIAQAIVAASETGDAGGLDGRIDVCDAGHIAGWAINLDRPAIPVRLEVLRDGVAVGETFASAYRPDLEAARLREGRCAFTCALEPTTGPCTVTLRRASDKLVLASISMPAISPRAA